MGIRFRPACRAICRGGLARSKDAQGMQGYISRLLLISALTLLAGFSGSPSNEVLRYRGEYTYGHEVNAFCPVVNSQCYWVGADTSAAVRATLKELATVSGAAPYTPVCMVIEGRIDRKTPRTGFAVDYDGLISVNRVFGRCDETGIVTQGDLQHHRWLLESIDNKSLVAGMPEGMIPEIDFGDRMFVAGNTGCHPFTGWATLREESLIFERMTLTRRACMGHQSKIDRTVQQVLGSQPVVRIVDERQLELKSDQAILRFGLSDWKQ